MTRTLTRSPLITQTWCECTIRRWSTHLLISFLHSDLVSDSIIYSHPFTALWYCMMGSISTLFIEAEPSSHLQGGRIYLTCADLKIPPFFTMPMSLLFVLLLQHSSRVSCMCIDCLYIKTEDTCMLYAQVLSNDSIILSFCKLQNGRCQNYYTIHGFNLLVSK